MKEAQGWKRDAVLGKGPLICVARHKLKAPPSLTGAYMLVVRYLRVSYSITVTAMRRSCN